jgi:hypothetical protein
MTSTQHTNEEKVVQCPVDGCEHEGLSRGIHLHVRQSSGGGHGPHGDTPESLDFDNLKEVGTKDVKMDYPDERTEEDVVRLCPYCGRAFNGFRGIKIHVGQKTGQGVHPEDATEITKNDCPIAHVDDDMNVIELVEENAIMPSTKQRILNGNDSIPKSEVLEFIEGLEGDGEQELADRVRDGLL